MKPDVDTLLHSWHAPNPDAHFEARVIQNAYRTPTLQEKRSSWLRNIAAALLLFIGGSVFGTLTIDDTSTQNTNIALYSTEEDDLWTL